MTTFTIWRADDGCVRIEDAEGGAIVLMPEEVPALVEQLRPRCRPETSFRSNGGHARAASLSPERRREIASEAARARWAAANRAAAE